ncbi:hypothetical protein O181_039833 [Austropuccinia psidii MF-1]|uniref:Tf2-1-like SH3-like domain-containing protein n=1 Tax=Austropuccinia psidii MF-1 TaxID=1389203 RepID=A0A9Q3DE55_9BASI|nr:hypothetical protein [Austropuccinia psidii MF-1]
MWKRACDKAAICIEEAQQYNKQRYENTHKKSDFREGDQVLMSTLNLNKFKGPKKMRDSFLGQFNIILLIGTNAVEVRLTEELSRKHPVFPVSLVKTYHHTGEDTFPSRNKGKTRQDIAEEVYSTGPLKKIMKARNIRLNV